MTGPRPPKAAGTGDPERDAWLREALRHAPDAGLAAPAALSDAILREARRSVQSSATGHEIAAGTDPAASAQRPRATAASGLVHRLISGPRRRLIDAWDALARPSVAAGLASVVAVVLAGMLWWDRPLRDAPPGADRAPKKAVRESADQRPMPATGTEALEPGTDAEPSRERRQADASTVAPAPAPPKAALAPSTLGRLPSTTSRPVAKPPQAPPSQSGANVPADQAPPNSMQRSPSAHLPPSAQLPSSRPLPPSTLPPSSTLRAELDRRSADLAVPSAAERPLPVTPGAAPAARAAAASSPLGALRAAVAAEPDRWNWAREGGRSRPVDSALQDWLERVDAASSAAPARAAGLTNSRSEAGRSGAAASPDADPAITLHLFRDGQPVATLRLGNAAFELATQPAAGAEGSVQRWRTPLAADRARALRADMP